MRTFVTGANGYLGKALVAKGFLPFCADVTKPDEIEREIKRKKPDLILHLASKSSPDWCEKKKNRPVVNDVNLRGTYNMFYRAGSEGVPCVFLSSDQIWKGAFFEEHKEFSKKTPPVNVYGIAKLAAESVVSQVFNSRIIRSSFVFDAKRLEPKIESLKKGETLYEPIFIRRSFIYLDDFVNLVTHYCENIKTLPNVLHLAGSSTVSWYAFMREVAKQGKLGGSVKPRFWENKGFAPRPYNGGLSVGLSNDLGFQKFDYVSGIRRMYES